MVHEAPRAHAAPLPQRQEAAHVKVADPGEARRVISVPGTAASCAGRAAPGTSRSDSTVLTTAAFVGRWRG